ncbi:MAG: sigma-54-dependent Fis family transcriptional regulator [Clostridia bacterium]|nr:sigma-54-dependent Fis family transcriptional regulator [Clostridia bacterium]
MKEDFLILLVDDESEYLEVIELILTGAGYAVEKVNSGRLALEKMKKKHYDLVLTDLIMPGMTGIELLDAIKSHNEITEVIIFTGYGSVKSAVDAMKKGAFSYFIKSHNPEELLKEIEKVARLSLYLKKPVEPQLDFMYETKNEKFKKVLRTLDKASSSDVSIMLLGESGVGKEILAQYIHLKSERNKGPFVAVNCHAFSETLLESELFGHEKGSFTGAEGKRIGRFEKADGGTLFLDEIGDTSLSTQVKLLRVLETRQIERIGSNTLIPLDFRLICATNRDLTKIIETGEFREDLYYRLNTIVVTIPPLRERKEDLPQLINYFLNRVKEQMQIEIKQIDETVIDALLQYDYPGNVRELRNIIERLVVLSTNGIIAEEDLPEHFVNTESISTTLKDYREQTEKIFIIKALEKNNFHMTQTADALGISRRQLFNKIEKYHIEK